MLTYAGSILNNESLPDAAQCHTTPSPLPSAQHHGTNQPRTLLDWNGISERTCMHALHLSLSDKKRCRFCASAINLASTLELVYCK